MTLPERLRELAKVLDGRGWADLPDDVREAAAIIERLQTPHYYWCVGETTTYSTLEELMDDMKPGVAVEVASAREFEPMIYVQFQEAGEILEFSTREAAEKARGG